jgi:hypothetical protein
MTRGSSRLVAALATLSIGCGGAESATSVVQAPTTPSATPPALPDEQRVAADPDEPTSVPAPPGPTDGPAFVVYRVRPGYPTLRTTVIVPLDPTRPTRSLEGIVVLDDATDPHALRWLTFSGDEPSPCTCACEHARAPGAYGELFDLRPDTFELASPPSQCVVPSDAPSCTPMEDAEEEEEDCEGAGGPLSTMVGGRVFVPLDTYEGCGGWNRYGNDLATFSITRAEWRVPPFPLRGVTCEVEHAIGGWPDVRRARAPLRCASARNGFRSRGPDDDCSFCAEERPGLVVARITRGVLQLIDSSVTTDATGTVWMTETALSARTCPSSADPCGDPAPFTALASAPPSADFWVATDGSAALLHTSAAPSEGQLALLAPGASTAVRTLTVPFVPLDVLGVRFHRDVGLLARLVDHGLPARRALACAAPAAVATPTRAPPVCEAGTHLEQGACAAIPLATEDVGFVDTHGGSDWGNRCFVHLRANALDAAEAACAAGLRVAERDTTRGAILYNLGRIAEARGDRAAARRHYTRSLEVRPGNAAVQRARDALDD